MDYGRILGAVLRGAVRRPGGRGAGRGMGPLGMNTTQTRQVGRAIGALATVAIEALSRSSASKGRPLPEEPPARRSPSRRIPDIAPREPPAQVELSAGAETAEARLLLRAMIAAARADGVVDREERAAISAQLDAVGLTPAERDHVLGDFDHPATIEELARGARDPMLAAQLYAAAFAAAGAVSPEERAWLDRLGVALKLHPGAIAGIEERLRS